MRVIAEEASVRTGPGFGYRSVYRANQGEVLTVIGRATHDHWFRVELPDGTYGWILGDEVFPLDVDTAAAHAGPSIWRRMGHAVFSPSPLMIENVTLHVLGRACWAATACSCSGPPCCWRRTCRWRRSSARRWATRPTSSTRAAASTPTCSRRRP